MLTFRVAEYFVDRSGTLTNKRRTATGGYLVDAVLARTGVLVYRDKSGANVNHLNTPEALQANLDGLLTVPVTNTHPARMVDPDSYRDVACGHVVGMPTFKDGKIFATLAIQDAELIEDIEAGRARQVSMGYMAHTDDANGLVHDGVPVHRVRTMLEWNHAAIVPAGRAGEDVCLVLDSADIPGGIEMKLTINGKEYDAEKAQAAIDALEALLENAREEAKDAAERLKAAKAELVEKTSDKAIGKLVQAKLDAAEKTKEIARKRAAVAKAYPKMKAVDAKSDETIESLYDTITEEQASVDALAPGELGGESSPETKKQPVATRDAAPRSSARDKMLARDAKLRDQPVETERAPSK